MGEMASAISVVGTAGVALVVAAVVGGGFTLAGIEVPVISSLIRQVLMGVVGAVLLVVDVAYLSAGSNGPPVAPATTTVPQPASTAPPTSRPPTTPAPPEAAPSCPDARAQPVRSGAVSDVDPRSGIDLDCGLVTGVEQAPGADVSGRMGGIFLDTVSEIGSLAWVDNLGPDDFSRCAALPFSEYRKTLRDLDKPQPGRGICVRTSDGNTAIILLDRPSTPSRPALSFHYKIQYRSR